MEEGCLKLRVRIFAHKNLEEVMDTLVQKLIEANVAHWEVEEDLPRKEVGNVNQRKTRAKDDPSKRVYIGGPHNSGHILQGKSSVASNENEQRRDDTKERKGGGIDQALWNKSIGP